MASSTLNGNTINELISKIEASTDRATALEVVGAVLLDHGISVGRPGFTFKTQFPKTSPTCVSNFSRKFQHKDWRDGQDLVQAEQTAGEDGFNLRFHLIEGDLDALRDDIRRAFDCLASMRASLFDMLNEVKAELTLVNGDLNRLEACCRQHEGPTLQVELPTDPYFGNKFLGTVNWLGKPGLAFATSRGVTVIPRVDGPEGPGDPRVKRVAGLARLLREDERITKVFEAGPVATDDLVKDFGDVQIDGGWTLEEALAILPSGSRYASPETLLKAVADREAAALRTSGEADLIVAAELGGFMDGGAGGAPVAAFEAVPQAARGSLTAAGISTLGALADADPEKVAAATGAEVGEAAGWVAAAGVVMGVG
jgi:hypothetical protein